MRAAGSDVEGEADRSGLFELVFSARRVLVIAFVVCGITGYLFSGLMRRAYRAAATVASVQSVNPGLAGGPSGLLGSLALTSLGLAPTADKNEAKEILHSRAVIQQFITERNLLPVLCKSGALDCDSAGSDGALAAERQMNDAVDLFRDNLLAVKEDTLSGMIYVSVVWYDRVLAADWCNGLIELTNRRMQGKARDLAAQRVKFLREEYERAEIVSVQSAVSSLLQAELSRAMDASTKPEYALRVVDRATVPDDRYPVRPRKAVIGAASGVFGALLTLAVAAMRRRRAR